MKRVLAILFLACLIGVGTAMHSGAAELENILFMAEELPPYSYQADGRIQGVSYEVLAAALSAVGVDIKQCDVEMFPWARIYDMTLHEPNTCAFTVRRSLDRESLFKWAGPIVDFRLALIFKSARVSIQKHSDIGKYVVGIMKWNSFKATLLEMGVQEENIVESLTPEKATTLFKHDRTDMLLGDERATYYALNQVRVASSELASYYLSEKDFGYFAFHKNVPDAVVARLQKGIDIIRKNGTLDAIHYKFRAHQ